MGSDQNPIHRDRGKRDQGSQPYQDDRETFAQKDAKIERKAPLRDDQTEQLIDEQREELARQQASDRLAEVQREVEDEKNTGQE